jgi:membrane-associated protease RseP (regulator of RpoE activity)
MEQDKRLYVVITAVGVLAILISTCFGAFAGGMAGYWAGRKVSRQVTEEYLRPFQEWRREPIEPQEPSPFPPERFPFGPEVGGALVTEVVEASPADRAGIQPGDLILAVDGVRLEEEDTLIRVIRRHRPGDRTEITLWSTGRERTISVRLGEHPDDKEAAYLGVYYQMLPMGMEGPGTD